MNPHIKNNYFIIYLYSSAILSNFIISANCLNLYHIKNVGERIHLDNYINYTKDEDLLFLDANELIKIGAIPNINGIEKELVKAIIPTHAHLDHVGAIPYLDNNFNCPIICTPFTKAVINAILKDEKIKIKNKIK